ncbi:MAG: DUF448 domain-containing protein [Actinobacteria bacterium]|nr:DUF448 domain-containing protein [Actinomycetota bacterium]
MSWHPRPLPRTLRRSRRPPGSRATSKNSIRTCAGCGRKAPQPALLRFHAVGGVLTAGAGPGRGAYTCRNAACFERARNARGFARILRTTVRVDQELARLYT